MTCFNPKYATYNYGPIYEEKHFERIIGTKKIKENGIEKTIPITEKVYYKTGRHHLGMRIKFNTKEKYNQFKEEPGKGRLIIPCGKCLGCKLDKSSEWGTRAVIENKQWKNNFFLTLTYNEKNIPKNHSLYKKDVQDFLKRLRESYQGIEPREWKGKIEYPIRMYYCGEYGPKTMRPHYHLAIFNWIPPDLKLRLVQQNGIKVYTSEIIEKKWGKGYHLIEELNYESACYIARYTIKKLFNSKDEYCKSRGIEPEFVETSRKGGIGYQIMENKKEFEKMKRNYGIFTITKKGIKLKKIPMYLRKKWKKENEESDNLDYFEISEQRRKEQEKSINEILSKTDLTKLQYIQQQKDLIIMKTKNSIKRKAV